MSSKVVWSRLRLKSAGVSLIDCDHQTPPAADHGYPYIAIPQLKNGHISLEGVRRISHNDYLAWTKKLKPQAHDVIVVRRCNSGESAHVTPGLECAIGQNLVILRSDGTTVLPEFLRWLINGPDWWEQVSKFINVGAVFDSLRCRDIPNFELTIPPIESQREISTILNAVDDRITLLRETNATLEAIAQALFKSWFVDFEPVRAKMEGRIPEGMDEATVALFPDGFVESELGLVPRGWHVAPMTSIADIVMGLSPKGESYNFDGLGVPLVNGPVEFGDYFPVKTKWTTSPDRLTVSGDLIFCVRGSTTGRRVVSDGIYCIGRGVCAIRAANGHDGFLYQTINFGIDRLLSKTTGSVFPSLSGPDIKNFLVLNPADGIASAYEDLTRPLLGRIQENHEQAQTLATLRDALLPRLITGQLRLLEAAAITEEALA